MEFIEFCKYIGMKEEIIVFYDEFHSNIERNNLLEDIKTKAYNTVFNTSFDDYIVILMI